MSNKSAQKFFDDQVGLFATAKSPRTDILFEIILPEIKQKSKTKLRVMDFGCGGGNLLLNLLDHGLDAIGIEKHDKLYNITKNKVMASGYSENCIAQGGVDSISQYKPN